MTQCCQRAEFLGLHFKVPTRTSLYLPECLPPTLFLYVFLVNTGITTGTWHIPSPILFSQIYPSRLTWLCGRQHSRCQFHPPILAYQSLWTITSAGVHFFLALVSLSLRTRCLTWVDKDCQFLRQKVSVNLHVFLNS